MVEKVGITVDVVTRRELDDSALSVGRYDAV
jgi:hypothetical protein